MIQTLDRTIQVLNESSKDKEFIETGFPKLNSFLDGGFLRKELVVIGGASGSGKSFLAGQIAENVAHNGFKTIYFSLEISNETVLSRIIGQKTDLKAVRIMCNLLTPEEKERKEQAEAELSPSNPFLHLSDSIYKMEEIANVMKKGKYEFVVVDFIQNVMTKKKDEYSSLTFVALELQRLAKECNSCVLVLSQLSNSANKGGENLEYKGSGGIVQVTDLGFKIKREPFPATTMVLELKKNRRGTYGQTDLIMDGAGCLIKEKNEYQR